jgi:hypothetical protein
MITPPFFTSGLYPGIKISVGQHSHISFTLAYPNHEVRSALTGNVMGGFRRNDIDQFEGYYASVFYASFAALGLDIVAEDAGNQGKLDMAVKFNGQVYLLEFKVVEDEAEGKALAQIKEKQYADKYRALNQLIHLIGIEFSKKARNVVGFAVEGLD